MKMRSAQLLAAASVAGWAFQDARAEEKAQQIPDLVVSAATLQETQVEKLGQSITVITREELEASKMVYVKDYLRLVPGLNLRSNGPNGNTSVSLRGLQPYHTKLLVDGVPYQDTTSPQVIPVLNTLQVEDIERIEIVRGASSTVNGSNAIGGVINIVTRSGKDAGKPVSGSVAAEYGSHGRQMYSGSMRGATGPVDYSFAASWLGERGISAMTDLAANGDDDPYRNLNLSGRIGLELAENVRLELFGRFTDADQEYDVASVWGPFVDSGDVHQQDWMLGTKLSVTDLFDGLLDTSVSLSTSESRRSYRDEDGWGIRDRFTGQTVEAKWLATLHLAEGYDFTVGVENVHESADTIDFGASDIDERHRTWAYLAELHASPVANLFLTAGLRHNDHSLFGGETTWSASARYLVEKTGTTLKAAAGKAYRAPSLYELYGPYGDPGMEPETSQNWEVGFEQTVGGNPVTFGGTYYEARIDDYIGWDPTVPPWGGYNQISGIKVHGVESFVRYQPWECLSLRATHTYQHTNNMATDTAPIAYRPSHMATLGATYTGCGDRLTVDLNGSYVGSRRTGDGVGGTKLESYCLVNLAASYDLTESLQIYGRIENLLNDGYETNVGYGTYGRCYYAGLKLTF